MLYLRNFHRNIRYLLFLWQLFEYLEQLNILMWISSDDSDFAQNSQRCIFSYQDEVEALNETVLAYSNADLNLKYETVWDNTNTALQTGFYLASYPLSLLAQRLINYVISRSINKVGVDEFDIATEQMGD